MITTAPVDVSHRDVRLLRAVAAGRCEVSTGCGFTLVVDGFCYSDQFAAGRLAEAELIARAGPRPGHARLTPAGRALLATY